MIESGHGISLHLSRRDLFSCIAFICHGPKEQQSSVFRLLHEETLEMELGLAYQGGLISTDLKLKKPSS
jgi:hypothetical protein